MEHPAQEIFEMHVVVKGNVQGVGFRALTRHHASDLGLRGFVRNLPNGDVEIHAQGEKPHLEALLQQLEDKTFPGQIEEASVEYFPLENTHEDFRILY